MLLRRLGGGECRAQLLQVGGIDVGNSPQLETALTPTSYVVAIMAQCSGEIRMLTGGPHKHVDDMLASAIDDRRHYPPLYVVQPAADQWEAPIGQLQLRLRKIYLSRKPWLHHMSVRSGHIDQMGGQQRAHMSSHE